MYDCIDICHLFVFLFLYTFICHPVGIVMLGIFLFFLFCWVSIWWCSLFSAVGFVDSVGVLFVWCVGSFVSFVSLSSSHYLCGWLLYQYNVVQKKMYLIHLFIKKYIFDSLVSLLHYYKKTLFKAVKKGFLSRLKWLFKSVKNGFLSRARAWPNSSRLKKFILCTSDWATVFRHFF